MTGSKQEAKTLRGFVESVIALNDQIGALQSDRREIFKSAKDAGFDPPMMKVLIRRMGMDAETVMATDALLEHYEQLMETGAASVGTLSMEKDAEGRFVFKIVEAPAEKPPTSKAQARRDSMAAAALARKARDGF